MGKKPTTTQSLDASIIAAVERFGHDWPTGLTDAIAKGHQTSKRAVEARRRALQHSV